MALKTEKLQSQNMFAGRTDWNLSPNRLAEALERHRAARRTVLDLTASNPTACGFQYSRDAILNALASPAALRYRPDPRGLQSAREAVRGYYAEHSRNVPAEQIILTASTSEGYSFISRLLCNPGDELLIPTPSYPLFDFLADLQDVKLIRYPVFYDHGWHIDFHELEQAITPRTRGLIVVHPNNPTGHFTKPEEQARLNWICATRGLAIIADEVFLDFSLEGSGPTSFSGNRDVLTFTMSGVSKISGLPQMKLAWIAVSGPEDQTKEALERLEVIGDTYLSVSTPVQLAAPALLGERHVFHKQLTARLRENLAELDAQLRSRKTCERLQIEGGWYAILRVPATRPDEELAIELLENEGVYLHPGHFYGFTAEGYLVLSLIVPIEEFGQAVQRTLSRF